MPKRAAVPTVRTFAPTFQGSTQIRRVKRDRDRALADSEVGVWLLAQQLPASGGSALAAMRRRALTPTVRLWAIRAPFASKELLHGRGDRWMPEMRNGIERAWWTGVEPDEEETDSRAGSRGGG